MAELTVVLKGREQGMTVNLVLGIACIVALIGAALAIAGWRGRRVDDHPICRRCRFDLHGLPKHQTACPECGASLDGRRAMRRGNRQRRMGVFATGALIAVITLSFIGLELTNRAAEYNWNSIKPDRMLLWEAERRHATDSALPLVLAELIDRIHDEERSQSNEHLARLLDRALDVQGDPDVPWMYSWGDLIDAVRTTDVFEAKHLKRYVEQGVRFEPTVRKDVEAGQNVRLTCVVDGQRLGRNTRLPLRLMPHDLRFGDVDLEPSGPAGRLVLGVGTRIAHESPVTIAVPPGSDTLDGVWLIDLFDLESPHDILDQDLLDQTEHEPAHTWEVHFSLPMTVQPEGADVITVHDDETWRLRMHELVSVDEVTGRRYPGSTMLTGFVAMEERPISLVADVYLEIGGQETLCGTVVITPHGRTTRYAFHCVVPEETDATSVTVILRPDVEHAREKPGITEVFGGELRLEDIPIIPAVLPDQTDAETSNDAD